MLNSGDFRSSQQGGQDPQNKPFYFLSQRDSLSWSEKFIFLVREKKDLVIGREMKGRKAGIANIIKMSYKINRFQKKGSVY